MKSSYNIYRNWKVSYNKIQKEGIAEKTFDCKRLTRFEWSFKRSRHSVTYG